MGFGLGWGMGTYLGQSLAMKQRNTSTLVCNFWNCVALYVTVQTAVAPSPINEAWSVEGAWRLSAAAATAPSASTDNARDVP